MPANFEPPVSSGYRWNQEKMVVEPASLATSFLSFKVPKASPHSSAAAEQSQFVSLCGYSWYLVSAPIFISRCKIVNEVMVQTRGHQLANARAQASVPYTGHMSFLWDLSGSQHSCPTRSSRHRLFVLASNPITLSCSCWDWPQTAAAQISL